MVLEQLKDLPGYIYVATPYTNYKHGHASAAYDAASTTAELVKLGYRAFSPIVHGHQLSVIGRIDPMDGDLWKNIDKAFVDAASACVVVKLDGWEESSGVSHEIKEFEKAGKPIVYIDPVTA